MFQIKYPQFLPGDLLNCIAFQTPCGVFPGPLGFGFLSDSFHEFFTYQEEYKQSNDFILNCCIDLFQLREDAVQFSFDSLSYDNPKEKIIQYIRSVSQMIDQPKPEVDLSWILFIEENELKEQMKKLPAVAIVREKFSIQWLSIMNTEEIWKNIDSLPLRLFFITARIIYEKDILTKLQILTENNNSIEDHLKSFILNIPYQDKPFGYRALLLLGCKLIREDITKVAEIGIQAILRKIRENQTVLESNGIIPVIVSMLHKFIHKIFEEKVISIENTPLRNIGSIIIQHLRGCFVCNLVLALQSLQSLIHLKNIEPLESRIGQLIVEIENDWTSAINVAHKLIQRRTYPSLTTLTQPQRIACICENDQFDEYLIQNPFQLTQLEEQCQEIIAFDQSLKSFPCYDKLIVNNDIFIYPEIESIFHPIFKADFPILVKTVHYNILSNQSLQMEFIVLFPRVHFCQMKSVLSMFF